VLVRVGVRSSDRVCMREEAVSAVTNLRRYQVSMAVNKSQMLTDLYGNEQIMDVIRSLSGCRLFSKRNQMFVLLLASSLTQCLEFPALLLDELKGSSLLNQLALVHHKYLGTRHDGLVSAPSSNPF
jgi:hypothetical protein